MINALNFLELVCLYLFGLAYAPFYLKFLLLVLLQPRRLSSCVYFCLMVHIISSCAGDNLAILKADIKNQMKLVNSLKKNSLWSKTFEEVKNVIPSYSCLFRFNMCTFCIEYVENFTYGRFGSSYTWKDHLISYLFLSIISATGYWPSVFI